MGYVDNAFFKLKTNLEITPTEEGIASRRQKRIRSHIDGHWDLDDDFLTGSYRRETKTKPLGDVDIFVVLDPDGAQAGLRRGPVSEVLNRLVEVLNKEWDDVVPDRMAAVISYGDEVASFEVVPAFKRTDVGRGYWIPDTLKGAWIATNPKTHHELTTAKNTKCGEKWVPFVKMVKAINRHLGMPVQPSFLIEVMALSLVGVDAEPFGRYQDEICWFLATAAERLDEPWPDPAGLGPDVNAEMTTAERRSAQQALDEAASTASRAVWLEDDGQERAAVEEWRKLFGSQMARP